MKTVSCIIPTYRLLAKLINCIEAIRRNTKNPFEIIVVNNGKKYSDGTKEWCSAQSDVVYLENEVNGFPSAINLGLKYASGDYLVWMNNDAQVGPDWDEMLINGMLSARKEFGTDFVDIIGPMSNAVGGSQAINIEYDVDRFDDASRAYSKKYEGRFLSGFISGFCLMHTRRLYEALGPLDIQFEIDAHGGYEDNDYVTRAILAGYAAAVDTGVLVHHDCSSTFRKYFADDKGGLVNRLRYFRKWYENNAASTDLGFSYRVRITNERHMDYFMKSLRRAGKIGNCIAIFNDHSTVECFVERINALLESMRIDADHCLDRYLLESKEEDFFDERVDRNRAIDICRSLKPDWIIVLDHDEVIEERFDRHQAERLMLTPDPRFKVFGFRFCTFHDNEELIRTDGTMGRMAGFRMFRNVPNRKIVRGNKIGLHCGNIPEFGANERMITGFRIEHYGYVDAVEDRARKVEYYNSLDTDLVPELVGATNYNHVADTSGLQLATFNPNNHTSVVLMVKNEEQHLGELLSTHFGFFAEIIVVDTGSSDNTVAIAKLFTDEVYDFTKNRAFFSADGSLMDFSAPRNFGLKKAKFENVFFMDADEQIKTPQMIREMADREHVDAWLFSFRNMQDRARFTRSESVRMIKNFKGMRFTGRIHETIEKNNHKDLVFARNDDFVILNHGFVKSKEEVQRKLEHYTKLILLSIEEDPNNAKMWACLGQHFANRKMFAYARDCMLRACVLNPQFYVPRKDLATLHLKVAGKFLKEVVGIIPESHPFAPIAEKMIEAVSQMTGEVVIGNPDAIGKWDVVEYQRLLSMIDSQKVVNLLDYEMSLP